MPVWLLFNLIKSLVNPSKRMLPPKSPPSGPRSIIQSLVFITSKLCSITITVFP